MRNLLEKAIVHILNGDQNKAEAFFHKFMVEKARQIHETLRQGEDIELKENWNSEIREEEYFGDDDLEGDDEGAVDDGMGGDDAAGADVGDEFGDAEPGADAVPAEGDEMADVVDDDEMGDDLGAEGESEGLEGKIDNIESKIDELTAEFDRLMAQMDGGDGELGDDDDLGDLGGDETDMEGEGDLGDVDDVGDETDDVTDMGMGGEEPSDIAGRMEDDMSDEFQPEHEMAEEADPEMEDDDEMLEDITESVLAELDRIATPAMTTDGKEIGSGGKTVSGNRDSMLPNHPADHRWEQAKPYLVKGGNNDSFERETPPSSGKVKIQARNNDAGVKKLTKVPPKGDASAKINSDFASRPTTQSIIDGKKSK